MLPSEFGGRSGGERLLRQMRGNLFKGSDRVFLHRMQHQRIDQQEQQRDSYVAQRAHPGLNSRRYLSSLPGTAGISTGALWKERFSTASRSPR